MKTVIFLFVFFVSIFCADGEKEDIYMLKHFNEYGRISYKTILQNFGDKEFTDSKFDSDYPQYANRPKKTYWGNDFLSIYDMGEKYSPDSKY